ncbi:MAG: shikimate dehydrogenase [Muribaculaceae bacterium]|nr:shikimate dehydrogenase [Muribaculaceae bacterium]
MRDTLSTTDYGLIGHPLGHSFSKAFFTELFAADGSGRSYDNFDLPALTPEALYALVLLNPALKGLNVTAPYKEEIISYLDTVDGAAAEVEAVNTVKIDRDSTGRVTALHGFNTDVVGFSRSIEPLVKGLPAGSGALVLGTGGAAKAVVYALRSLGLVPRTVSRTAGKGDLTYADLTPELVAANPVVVNATPCGTWPNTETCPPFPYEYLSEQHIAHDLVYNPEETEFMRRAAACGATVKNGLDMLLEQARAALDIWQNNQNII